MWKFCPLCGGKIVDRGILDDEATIKVRLEEYENRTKPILNYFQKEVIKLLKLMASRYQILLHKTLLNLWPKSTFFD